MFHWDTACTTIPFQIVNCTIYNAKPRNDAVVEMKARAHLQEKIVWKYFEVNIK